MKRCNWLPAPAAFNLNTACIAVNNAFDGYGCYLVGSALQKRDYRDVDVRFIMKDEAWERMFGADSHNVPHLNPLWSLVCSGVACWLQQQTGLPVDFQIQQQSAANADYPNEPRHPLGMFTSPNPRDHAAALAKESP